MEFYPNWISAILVFMGLVLLGLALFCFLAAPYRLLNRFVGALYFVVAVRTLAGGVAFAASDQATHRAAAIVALITDIPTMPLAFVVLGFALDTPLARWLRSTTSLVVLAIWTIAFEVLLFVREDLFISGYYTPNWGRMDWSPGPLTSLTILISQVFGLFAIVASVDAYRRTRRGTMARRRAHAFMWAFGIQGAYNVVIGLAFTQLQDFRDWTTLDVAVLIGIFVTVVFVAAAFIVYGVLRAQLFDVDLKVQHGVRRGTLALFFLSAFFIATQLVEASAQRFFGGRGWIIGAVAAGLMLLALQPLHRIADRFSKVVLPHAQSLATLPIEERAQLYREQLEAAWADGMLTKAERRILEVSRNRLQLTADEASSIERSVFG